MCGNETTCKRSEDQKDRWGAPWGRKNCKGNFIRSDSSAPEQARTNQCHAEQNNKYASSTIHPTTSLTPSSHGTVNWSRVQLNAHHFSPKINVIHGSIMASPLVVAVRPVECEYKNAVQSSRCHISAFYRHHAPQICQSAACSSSYGAHPHVQSDASLRLWPQSTKCHRLHLRAGQPP